MANSKSRISSQISKFIRECSKSFRLLGDSTIRFSEPRAIAGQKMRCILSGPGAVKATTEKYTYSALPLPVSSYNIFWIASSLVFKTNRNHVTPESANIIVLSGDAYDVDKVPLLRAEWDSNTDSDHAQPHWHMYNSRISALPSNYLVELDDYNVPETPAYSTPINEHMSKFHLAMCANWSSKDRKCVHSIDNEENLANWIAYTLDYIQAQLGYTMRKQGQN